MGLLEEMVDHGISFKINDEREEIRVTRELSCFSMTWLNGKEISE